MKRKKILMIGAYPPMVGGVAQVVYYLVKNFSHDYTVKVISPDLFPESSLTPRQDELIKYTSIPYKKRYVSFQILFFSIINALKTGRAVDLIHTHGPFYSGICYIYKSKPMVLTQHGYPSLESISRGRIKKDSIQYNILRFFEKKAIARADAVITVDSTIENWVIKELCCNPKKVCTITNGVDTNIFKPQKKEVILNVRRKYKIKNSERVIISIRKFVPKNGVQNVLEGFITYKQIQDDDGTKLILAGGGPLKKNLQKRIKREKLGASVIILDHINHKDIPSYYSAADIIINSFTHLPLVEEFTTSNVLMTLETGIPIGTSLTTVEALAMGKPVILSTVGGIYNGVNFDDLGVITSDNNPNEIASAIAILSQNQSQARRMGERARKYIVTHRDWHVVAKKVQKVYNRVLMESR